MIAHHGKFIGYYRVSTDKQGIDGYGVDAQRKAVKERLDGGGWQLVTSFTEVESGRRKSRPELLKALAACKKHRAKLVVAKLDRLTRDTKFLLTLLDSGVEVLFCDLPTIPGAMGKLMVTMMAAIAEFEAGVIGERTKNALAAAKASGKKLGGMREGSKRMQTEAVQRAVDLGPTLTALADLSASAAAKELNRRKIATPQGRKWHAVTVQRVRARLATRSARKMLPDRRNSVSDSS